MTNNCRSLLNIILILAIAIVPYLNTLDKSFSFIFDDIELISKNPNIRDLSFTFIKDSFINKTVYNVAAGDIYRPFYIILYAIEYRLWDLTTTGYHAVNLLLNAANSLIVYLLLSNLLRNKNLSLFAALIFAVHPVHTENVAWIKESTSLISSLFMLSALFYFLRYRKLKANMSLITSVILFIFSLLSKETSIVFPMIVVMIDICLFRNTSLKEKWLSWAPFFLLSAIFLWVRTMVLGQVAMQEYYYGGSFETTLFTMFRVIAYYVKLFIFPIDLCGDYLQYPLSTGFDLLVAASACLIVTFLVAAWRQMRKAPIVTLGIAVFFLTLLPVLNIVPVKILIAERFMYLPSFGLILSVSAFIDGRAWNDKIKRTWAALSVVLIILFSVLTYERNFVWQSQYTFWSDTVKKMPKNPRAHYNLALSQSDLDVRIKELKAALYLNPTDDIALSKLAWSLYQKGDYNSSIEYYGSILKRSPGNKNILNNLGIVYFEKGDYTSAKNVYEKLLASDPDNIQILNNLGSVYDMLNEYDKAIDTFNKALSISPGNLEIYFSLGVTYNRKGMHSEAEKIYKNAIRIDSNSEQAHYGLGETYFNMADYSGASSEFKKVVDVNPKNPDAYYNLAYIDAVKGDFNASISWLEKAVGWGFEDIDSLKKEKVFAPLTGSERFKNIIHN